MNPASSYANYSSRARRLAWALDRTIGPPLGLAASGLARAFSRFPAGPPSILLIRCDHLGDLLMATPAIRALRRIWQDAKIDCLVSPPAAPALGGNPDVNAVATFDAPWYEPRAGRDADPVGAIDAAVTVFQRRYDIVVEMRGDPRLLALAAFSAAPRRLGFAGLGLDAVLTQTTAFDARRSHVERNFDVLRPLGVGVPADVRPVLEVPRQAFDRAERIVRRFVHADDPVGAGEPAGAGDLAGVVDLAGAGGYAVVAPATARPTHTWGERNFALVADGLVRAGVRVLIAARASESPVAARVLGHMRERAASLAGKTDLMTLAAVLAGARLVVANDSGTVHVAAAVGCPAVAVFGPTSPALSFPYAGIPGYKALAGPAPCERPCFDTACSSDHGYRMVSPEIVLRACQEVMR